MWQRHLTCTVQETFKDTLVCVGLRRIVTVGFFCAVYKYSYILTYTQSLDVLRLTTRKQKAQDVQFWYDPAPQSSASQ